MRLNALLREPQAITETLEGPRISKDLNLFNFANFPIVRQVHGNVQEAGPRKVCSNTLEFQSL
jgi:hypothetical protein